MHHAGISCIIWSMTQEPQLPTPQQLAWHGIRRLTLRWLISALAIFVAIWIVPGITFSGPGWQLGIVAMILGLLNSLVRPLLVLFVLPLVILTLGLFVFVINAGLLLLASTLADAVNIAFQVDTFWDALWGGLVISLVSSLLNFLAGEQQIQVQINRGNFPPN